jgi:hypothetical protein
MTPLFTPEQSTLILDTLAKTDPANFRDEWIGMVPVTYGEDDCHRRIVSDFTVNMLCEVYEGQQLNEYLKKLYGVLMP